MVLENQQDIQLEEDTRIENRMHSFLVNKFPLLTEQVEMYALCTVATDISDRKQAESILESAALTISEASGEKVFDVIDRVLSLEMGADDYIVKPFELREVQARIKSVLRRSQQPNPQASVKPDTIKSSKIQLGIHAGLATSAAFILRWRTVSHYPDGI